jgi:deoxyguanosine kinase
MKSQNQVILSLGTNQGDRLRNIENCLHLIHQEVGTVIKVSKLYESPSWGFDSDAFYNCALVLHTFLAADAILSKILEIETQLGRVRNSDGEYLSLIHI